MANITATLAPSDEIAVTKFAELPANFTLSQLTDTTITSPSDGSFLVYDNSSTRWIDDQTIVKTSTGITLSGTLVATALDISGDIDVDGTLEADAITVNGITLAETISDTVGNMITDSNTESGIAVTYDDSDNTLDFNVDDFSITLTGDVAGSGTVTNLGNVSFATTIQAGSLENDMLAGSIANAKLSNSTVSYGGISLALGANDDTPAFNLQDATGYPTSSLVGTITNAQLSNSTVNFGGVSVALGASDTTPAFDLQHATNLPATSLTGDMPNARIVVGNVTQHQAALSVATSQLSGTISNSQLAGSITNDKLSNSSITVSDGSNTSPVALGGTLTFAGTSNEVTVAESSGTVTIGLPDDIAISGELEGGSLDINGNADISGNLVLDGNLTVSGTTTTVNTSTLTVEDPLIKLASGNASGDTVDIGLYGLYDNTGSQDVYSGIFRDATDDKWKLFKSLEIEPTATVNTSGAGYAVDTLVANLEGNVTGALTGALTGNADTATTLATARDIGGVSFNGSASINLPGVNAAGNQDTSGTAATVTVANSTANTNFPVVFNDESDGLLDDTGTFIYNPSTGLVSATGFSGDLTGTLQTAAQTNVTSVGTLTSLTAGQITSNATKFELTDITDSASAGPAIELYRNGGNGSNADELGIIRFYGNNAIGNKTEFATIYSEIHNSSGTGRLLFGVNDAGSIRDVMRLTASGVLELNEVSPSAASGPRIDLVRDNSNSSDEDEIGSIQFKARDDAGNTTTYAEIYSEIAESGNTAETGEIRFKTITAGSNIDPMLTLSGAGSTLTSSLTLGATSATVGGKILFKEGTDGGTNAVSLIGPATTEDVTVTLPNATGTLALTTSNVSSATLASTVTVANSTANTDFPVVFHDESNGLLDDTGALTYNPSTGALVSSGTISAYVSTSEAAQLRAGREDGQDISIFCSDTINSIVADQDTDANSDQQFVLNRTFNGNSAQSSNNSYFKIQNNGSTELEIKGGWTDNSVSETTLNTATTVNGALTVSSGITGSQTLAPTTDTSISVSEFAAFAGKKIIYTGGAGTIALPAAVAADNGKSWVIINAGTGTLTIDVDGSSTAQYVRFLTGGAVTTSNSANRIIAAGGSAELVCIADGSATNSATVPNYLIYGGGIS